MRSLQILCGSIGCLIHIILLTIEYMEYNISTNVEFLIPDKITLPDITICSEILAMLDWENQRVRHHCRRITGLDNCQRMDSRILRNASFDLGWKDCMDRVDFIYNEFTINDLISNLTIPAATFVPEYRRFDPVKSRISLFSNLNDSFIVHESLMSYRKCFTFQFIEELANMDYWLLRRRPSVYTGFAKIHLNNSFIDPGTQMTISLTSHKVPPSLSSDVFYSKPSARGTAFEFDLFQSYLLPAPFQTDCRNYGKHQDRITCYDTCYADHYIRRWGRKPMPMRMNVRDKGMKSSTLTQMFNDTLRVIDLDQFCSRQCEQQECIQVHYITRVLSAEKVEVNESELRINFDLPSSPILKSVSSPSITIEVFITNLCSTFGFWLGISVLSFMDDILALFHKAVTAKIDSDVSVRIASERRRNIPGKRIWTVRKDRMRR